MQAGSPDRVDRRLIAILAADVAGYSRLMGADEEGTLAALKAIRRELGDPKITEHRGCIVKTTGDGLLVEFQSVVDAVRCAVEVQQGMAGRNADVPEDRRIQFRIGVNLGDVILDEGDIFGDGVNIAARLEALAEPGGICLGGSAHEQVRDKLDLAFEDLGERQIKNITRPVRVYRIRLGEAPTAAAAPAAAPPLPDKPSIAVLPFQNMSGDPEQEYFVDGMVEENITDRQNPRKPPPCKPQRGSHSIQFAAAIVSPIVLKIGVSSRRAFFPRSLSVRGSGSYRQGSAVPNPSAWL
jgi:class 3 adenylate cyclase